MSYDIRDFEPTATLDQRLRWNRDQRDVILKQIRTLEEAPRDGYVIINRVGAFRGLTLAADPDGGIRWTGTLFGFVFPTVTDAEAYRGRFPGFLKLEVIPRTKLIDDAIAQQEEFHEEALAALARIQEPTS